MKKLKIKSKKLSRYLVFVAVIQFLIGMAMAVDAYKTLAILQIFTFVIVFSFFAFGFFDNL